MILKRFFKPRIEHADPEVRRSALQTLDPADPALARLAREDGHGGVRRAALARIADLRFLLERAQVDPEAGVRDFAQARLQKLMAEASEPGECLGLMEQPLPPAVVEFLAIHADAAALRLAAVERLGDEARLEDRALNDPSPEVRLAALEGIGEAARLASVARQSRGRDKRVHRRARDRLAVLESHHTEARRLREICEAMEALGTEPEPDLLRFQQLERGWQEGSVQDSDLATRFEQARERVNARLEAAAARRAAWKAGTAALESLLERIEGAGDLTPELRQALDSTLAALPSDEPRGAAEESEHQRQRALRERLHGRTTILERDQRRAGDQRRIIRRMDTLATGKRPPRERDLETLSQRWQALDRPADSALAEALQTDFEAARNRVRTRLQHDAGEREQALAELQGLLPTLEQALDQGLLQEALDLDAKARAGMRLCARLPGARIAALSERLHHTEARLAELKDWRRWGTAQAREHLCEEAETLPAQELDPMALAQRVRELRAQWKRADQAEGGAPRALWERFHRACEEAYQPAQAHFDTLTRERESNLERKQALCQSLERLLEETDWAHPDWHAVWSTVRSARAEWRRTGPVGRAERKPVEERFRRLNRALDRHLGPERRREVQRREDLIERLEALVGSDELEAAMAECKRAQSRWTPTVQASRDEEQALWQRFRAACDAIFQRRDELRQATRDTVDAALQARIELCEELEALTPEEDDALDDAQARLAEARRTWASLDPPPRARAAALERRFQRASQHLEALDEARRRRVEVESLHGLREKSALCEQLEAAALQGPDEAAVRAAQAVEAHPPLPDDLERTLVPRIEAARAALEGEAQAREDFARRLASGLESREALCLRLELLAGVDSPAHQARQRMAIQVERLARSLGQAGEAPRARQAEARAVEQAWHREGVLPGPGADALGERFRRATAALDAAYLEVEAETEVT